MVAIEWCKKQNKGIKLIEQNENLCREYMESAEETLSILKEIKGKSNMWLATTKYYCEYFAVYALLMKIGIKCEIHDCTIEIAKFLEKEKILPRNTSRRLDKDKKLRIDNQYYLKNREVDIDCSELAEFVLTVKNLANSLTFDEIKELRQKIKNM